MRSLLKRIDPFLLQLVSVVALAALLPARGQAAEWVGHATGLGVALLFFLHGAKLAPRAVLGGLLHWRLQGLVLASTFLVFPLAGLALTQLLSPWLPPALALGIMFICVLPSTVQSSIAFTSVAGGNVPAALCAATISNVGGMLLTPLLVAWLMQKSGAGGFSPQAMADIGLHLLLPFLLGQAARPLIGGFLTRHRTVVSLADRGSILLAVYAAFSEGMVAGIWGQMNLATLALLVGLSTALLALVLLATWGASRALGFARADEVVAVFCGSKKSLASGIPMANILFPAAIVGPVVLPLMLFHQIQLFACAALARRYAARAAAEAAPRSDAATPWTPAGDGLASRA
ncbi:bile acid:sodium symporter family protein [Teichococcus cervicalis]|uniref:Sodium bile acid symporter family protein n=1 Tax=Pseudoroseomonas cervicalis ATCC 49957 TaxID=525371 RepID=D5RPB8_9PROT|nr:bile acid:sodium symporter family protein [Pseudoroseomonas cervicalis]EFH10852.1 sodium bile acid symporter family protein [Pseudoroseomonas cervicalis ATCC 49957]